LSVGWQVSNKCRLPDGGISDAVDEQADVAASVRSGRAVILRVSHSPDRRWERLPSAGACHTLTSNRTNSSGKSVLGSGSKTGRAGRSGRTNRRSDQDSSP